jgi:histone acetyltransferase (RNA polymerase elongator complex component)
MSNETERFFSLEAKTTKMFTGKVRNEEMRKRDFRKALQITGLSVISSLIVAVIAFLVEF